MVGNDLSAESNYGKLDAFTGLFLKIKGTEFEVIPSRASGFYVPYQSNYLSPFTDAEGGNFIIATQNNQEAKVFKISSAQD